MTWMQRMNGTDHRHHREEVIGLEASQAYRSHSGRETDGGETDRNAVERPNLGLEIGNTAICHGELDGSSILLRRICPC